METLFFCLLLPRLDKIRRIVGHKRVPILRRHQKKKIKPILTCQASFHFVKKAFPFTTLIKID
jgi:hypothetical protein